MVENPKKYTEPKSIHITLSDDAYNNLEKLSDENGESKSKIISSILEMGGKSDADTDM